MKKYIYRVIALMIFASVAMSGCSAEYREHRKEVRSHDHDHDVHDDNHHDSDNR